MNRGRLHSDHCKALFQCLAVMPIFEIAFLWVDSDILGPGMPYSVIRETAFRCVPAYFHHGA